MSVHSEPHIRDHTNEESVVHMKLKLELFAILFSYGIVVSVKKLKEISLLKRQCHKKIRLQTTQVLVFLTIYSCTHEQRTHHDKMCTKSAVKLFLLPHQNGGAGAFMGVFFILVDILLSSKLLIYSQNYLWIQLLLKRVIIKIKTFIQQKEFPVSKS